MFNIWTNIFTTDCSVIKMPNGEYVYPIFKNGFSSLQKYAQQNNCKILKNKDISTLEEVQVFLRDPAERFVSGVHSAIELNKISDQDLYFKLIEKFETYDRHFIPQVYWLLHLFKYFKKKVKISSVKELYDLIPNRNTPNIQKLSSTRKEKICLIKKDFYTNPDKKLIEKYLGKTVELTLIIKDFKYALSSS